MSRLRMAKARYRRAKYGAKPKTVHGRRFDSQAEARRYQQLLILGLAGDLQNLELQPTYPLVVNGVKVGTYRADFAYDCVDTGARVVEDVKGLPTPVYRLKKRLVRALHGIDIQEIRFR